MDDRGGRGGDGDEDLTLNLWIVRADGPAAERCLRRVSPDREAGPGRRIDPGRRRSAPPRPFAAQNARAPFGVVLKRAVYTGWSAAFVLDWTATSVASEGMSTAAGCPSDRP